MARRPLASTRSADLRPLGTAGQRSFDLVRREAEALGPRHAALFAEPFPSPEGDVVDWYAATPGTATALEDATPEAQAAGRAELARLAADLRDRAEALATSAEPERRRLGEALRQALEIPDERSVHLVGDQPVLTGWAHHRNLAQPPSNLLVGMLRPTAPAATAPPPGAPLAARPGPAAPAASPAPAPAPPPAPAERRGSFGWLWWLLWGATGALAAAIAWILLPACGLGMIGGVDFCPRAAASAAAPEAARHAALEAELRSLQREVEQADLSCLPAPPPEPQERAEAPSSPDEFEERVRREGGETEAPLTITLVWDTRSDLDLWVNCPAGGRIRYDNRLACGGELDIDQNAGGRLSPEPVENVFFSGEPVPGSYSVRIHNYRQDGPAPNDFRLRIRKGGREEVHEGRLTRRGEYRDFTFSYP